MGSCFEFTCEKCGYRAVVSGGRDCGIVAVVETMVCLTCRELVDVLIGRYGKEGRSGDADYDRDMGVCPRCRGRDLLPWGDPKLCPKCGAPMIKGELTVLWD